MTNTKQDTSDIDWIEQEKPTILCLCKFEGENMVGHYWEINDLVKADTFREAVRLYRVVIAQKRAAAAQKRAPYTTPKHHIDLRPPLARSARLP